MKIPNCKLQIPPPTRIALVIVIVPRAAIRGRSAKRLAHELHERRCQAPPSWQRLTKPLHLTGCLAPARSIPHPIPPPAGPLIVIPSTRGEHLGERARRVFASSSHLSQRANPKSWPEARGLPASPSHPALRRDGSVCVRPGGLGRAGRTWGYIEWIPAPRVGEDRLGGNDNGELAFDGRFGAERRNSGLSGTPCFWRELGSKITNGV